MDNYNDSVFINCPFDETYTPLLRGIIFCVYRCGFIPITALNEDNGLDNRLHKIEQCIEGCKYGIHDLSRTELNQNLLPRFNMPFELGIFFGAKRFGDKQQRTKSALIFDKEKYRYQEFISDLNGVDIKAHDNSSSAAVHKVREWLATASRRTSLPGYVTIQKEYIAFEKSLPKIVKRLGLEIQTLSFNDLCLIIEECIRAINN
jgi:hypothetical protein